MRSRNPDTRATMSTCRELSVWATKLTMYGMACGVTVMTVTTGAGPLCLGRFLGATCREQREKAENCDTSHHWSLRFQSGMHGPAYLRADCARAGGLQLALGPMARGVQDLQCLMPLESVEPGPAPSDTVWEFVMKHSRNTSTVRSDSPSSEGRRLAHGPSPGLLPDLRRRRPARGRASWLARRSIRWRTSWPSSSSASFRSRRSCFLARSYPAREDRREAPSSAEGLDQDAVPALASSSAGCSGRSPGSGPTPSRSATPRLRYGQARRLFPRDGPPGEDGHALARGNRAPQGGA